ncbi:Na(+)-translocating NADH-quinone reductase subunit C [Spirochaetota bacterium]
MKKDSIAYVVVFTFVICAVFVGVLAIANESTKAAASANKEFALQSAVLGAFGISYSDKADAASKYKSSVNETASAGGRAWKARLDNQDYSAVEASGPGLWGTITVILAASPDGERVRGIRLVSQNETPGLGGRIEEPWFLGQYEGEKAAAGKIAMRAGAESSGKADPDKENGRVEGISGATRTSQAFGDLVESALAKIKAMGGK